MEKAGNEYTAKHAYEKIVETIMSKDIPDPQKQDMVISMSIKLGLVHGMHILSNQIDQTENFINKANFVSDQKTDTND